jgi:hypothetical protein
MCIKYVKTFSACEHQIIRIAPTGVACPDCRESTQTINEPGDDPLNPMFCLNPDCFLEHVMKDKGPGSSNDTTKGVEGNSGTDLWRKDYDEFVAMGAILELTRGGETEAGGTATKGEVGRKVTEGKAGK